MGLAIIPDELVSCIEESRVAAEWTRYGFLFPAVERDLLAGLDVFIVFAWTDLEIPSVLARLGGNLEFGETHM